MIVERKKKVNGWSNYCGLYVNKYKYLSLYNTHGYDNQIVIGCEPSYYTEEIKLTVVCSLEVWSWKLNNIHY